MVQKASMGVAAAVAAVASIGLISPPTIAAVSDATPSLWNGPLITGSSNSTGYLDFALQGASSIPVFTDSTGIYGGSGLNITSQYTNFFQMNNTYYTCQYTTCLRPLLRAPDSVSTWPYGNQCPFYTQSTLDQNNPTSSYTFNTYAVPPGLAHLGVYTQVTAAPKFSPPPVPIPTSCSFTISLSGLACPSGSYGGNCSSVIYRTQLESISPSNPFTVSPSNPLLFELNPTDQFSRLLSVSLSIDQQDATSVMLYERQYDLPRPQLGVYDYNQSIVKNSPISGLNLGLPAYRVADETSRYFYALIPSPSSSALRVNQVNVSEAKCDHGYMSTDSKKCDIILPICNEVSTNGWQQDNMNNWLYFEMAVSGLKPGFSIGVTPVSNSLAAPDIYIRLGNLPTDTQYDIKVNSSMTGAQVRFYASGNTLMRDALWYVGVKPSSGAKTSATQFKAQEVHDNHHSQATSSSKQEDKIVNPASINWLTPYKPDQKSSNGNGETALADSIMTSSTFILWLGSDCPNSCLAQGRCVNHVCQCNDGWTALDCSIPADNSGNRLSSAAKVILPMLSIFGSIALGFALCHCVRKWTPRPGMPGQGHHIGGGGGGGGGGAGGDSPVGPGGIQGPPGHVHRMGGGVGPRANIHGYSSV